MADKNKQITSHEVTNRKGCLITKTTDSERDGGDVQRISDCKERGKLGYLESMEILASWRAADRGAA